MDDKMPQQLNKADEKENVVINELMEEVIGQIQENAENDEQKKLEIMDLPAELLIDEILNRVPAGDLVTACTGVSKQWHRLLSAKSFWIAKMRADGYELPFENLAGLSLDTFKKMAVKRPFARNFIRDRWDFTRRDDGCLQMDARWTVNRRPFWQAPGGKWRNIEYFSRIEVPPGFARHGPNGERPQPEMGPELGGEPVLGCLATNFHQFNKVISIRLEDEGLTDELMDTFRPSFVLSELVATRSDCNCTNNYGFRYSLSRTAHESQAEIVSQTKTFEPGEAEKWHLMEHKFKQYPPGMRYLNIYCNSWLRGEGGYRNGFFGVKVARCTAMALCEGNAVPAHGEEVKAEAVQEVVEAVQNEE